MKHYSIAIDGPSGAGKSTLARMLAQEFELIYVDTGAMYRAVGLHVARCNINSKDSEKIIKSLPNIKVSLKYEDGCQHIYLNGENVSQEIRTEQASKYAADVSAVPEVREFLLNLQRSMAENGNIVMDGRDIGTVVLPKANVKIFLTADSLDRAKRRHEELIERGENTTLESVHQNILERDKNDSTRATAPLKAAEDAILCDTTAFPIEKSFEVLKKIIKERLKYAV